MQTDENLDNTRYFLMLFLSVNRLSTVFVESVISGFIYYPILHYRSSDIASILEHANYFYLAIEEIFCNNFFVCLVRCNTEYEV